MSQKSFKRIKATRKFAGLTKEKKILPKTPQLRLLSPLLQGTPSVILMIFLKVMMMNLQNL